jgi:dethiobiotin synthetase
VKSLFVTSTGTGIGKTLVTAALVRELRARGEPVRAAKPVISGYPGESGGENDTDVLLRAQELRPSDAERDAISPWRFRAALSPDMAAAREGRAIDFAKLVEWTRERRRQAPGWLLVEGVGGVCVPIDERHTVLDWIAATGFPALLVAGGYLGTLSHTLTAASVLRARGVELAGVVLSESDESPVPLAETRASLLRFLGPVPCALLPRLAPKPDPWRDAPPLLRELGLAAR